MPRCNKCMDTGWRLLPVVDPVDALPCDRCDAPQMKDPKLVMRAHGYVEREQQWPHPDEVER